MESGSVIYHQFGVIYIYILQTQPYMYICTSICTVSIIDSDYVKGFLLSEYNVLSCLRIISFCLWNEQMMGLLFREQWVIWWADALCRRSLFTANILVVLMVKFLFTTCLCHHLVFTIASHSLYPYIYMTFRYSRSLSEWEARWTYWQ